MNKITYLLSAAVLSVTALLSIPQNSMAQVPKDITEFESHGIKVILRNTSVNDVVAAYLGFEGGLAYGETSNPTLAPLTANVLAQSGSKNYPKEKYQTELAKLSTSISGSGTLYNTAFSLRTIAPNFNKAWDIFSDLILNPAFDETEFKTSSKQLINSIKARASNPEGYTEFVLDSLWKGNSPLNRAPQVSDVEALSTGNLADYINKLKERSRMVLVVVGKVSRQDLESKLARFEALKQGTFKMAPMNKFAAMTSSQAHLMNRKLPTTYIAARFPAPELGTKDWWAARVLTQILNKRLFDEVRTKRNLSYAPGSYATGTHNNFFGEISLQSILPDSAISVVLRELQKLQTQLVPTQELEDAKAGRITTYFFILQTNLDQARNLYTNLIESGDWRNLFRVTEETNKVTATDVKRVANQYMHNLLFVTMGPEGAASQSKFKFN